jgi:hypothetical protein
MPANEPWPGKSLLQDVTERRRKPRRSAKGVIVFTVSQSDCSKILGFLLDLSPSGFRAAHRFRELSPGQQVAFQYDGACGLATVVWTRIIDESVESGFVITQQEKRTHPNAIR